MSVNRVIGRQGKLPWHLPEDLKWFKKLTLGQPVLMGRKTAESLEKPLPKRRNLVLSRSDSILAEGFERLSSVAQVDALQLEGVVWVIGGAEIFRLLLPRIQEVYLSHVHEVHEGDTFLPAFETEFEVAEILATHPEFELRRWVRKS